MMNYFLKIASVLILINWGAMDQNKDAEKVIDQSISIQNLSKKWKLDKYQYEEYTETPSDLEKNDFLHLKSDLTFSSITEGNVENGQWRLDVKEKRIFLFQKGVEGEMALIIHDLSVQQLVMSIDDPTDEETRKLKIYYKN